MGRNIYLKEEKLLNTFNLFDIDGNGTIDKDELKKILGSHNDFKDMSEEYWDNLIKEADSNGDGTVNYIFIIL